MSFRRELYVPNGGPDGGGTAAKAAISFLRWTTALIHWWISGTSAKMRRRVGKKAENAAATALTEKLS